jgi:hypothetical protein
MIRPRCGADRNGASRTIDEYGRVMVHNGPPTDVFLPGLIGLPCLVGCQQLAAPDVCLNHAQFASVSAWSRGLR